MPLTRSNNVAIMLTQFADLRDPAADVCTCVLAGKGLSVDRLSLLLQARAHACCAGGMLCWHLMCCKLLWAAVRLSQPCVCMMMVRAYANQLGATPKCTWNLAWVPVQCGVLASRSICALTLVMHA